MHKNTYTKIVVIDYPVLFVILLESLPLISITLSSFGEIKSVSLIITIGTGIAFYEILDPSFKRVIKLNRAGGDELGNVFKIRT